MRLVYVHLARFPVQRRVVEMPSLAGKPFALIEESRGQRRVAFASGAALKEGVRPGMTLTAACALLPSLAYFTYQAQDDVAALSSLGEALIAVAPAFQLSAPDGMWLDASAAHLCQGEAGLCERVEELCSQHGYRARVVVATGAFTARALARYADARVSVVAPREGARALAALPLMALEASEKELMGPLAALGLTTLGQVAALPRGAVVARLGSPGLVAQRLCRGEDDTPLVPTPVAEVLEESLSLEWPAESMEPLLFAMKTTLDRLCARLAGRKRAAVRLTFALRLDPSGARDVSVCLARPSAQAKLLLELAKHQIDNLTLDNPVAGLRVRVEESCEDRGQQLSLGDDPSGDAALEVVLSRLTSALGEEALFSAELAPVHRPESAYVPRPFRLPAVHERKESRAGARQPAAKVDAVLLERPSRLLAQPAALDADLGAQGALVAARLMGKRRKVTAIAGPERLTGEWWAPAPLARDYFRVHFEGLGPVWVYRDAQDGRFYLQGMFD